MSKRRWMMALAVCALTALGVGTASAQTGRSTVPRTADGRPDLQGVWDFRTLTPLQRPADQSGNAVLTAEEVAEIEARAAQSVIDADRPDRGPD
jgi:hypothetical protein